METELFEFFIKYWLNIVLGLVAGGLGYACKRFYTLWKNEQDRHQKEFYNEIKQLIEENLQVSKAGDEKLRQEIDVIKAGLLSLQSQNFKRECQRMLDPDVEFSVQEFQSLQQVHQVYNSLGGNSDGDDLFQLVYEKAKHLVADGK